jgi:hypothetical protein
MSMILATTLIAPKWVSGLAKIRSGQPLEGELGRPRRKNPHRTVRTKYIGQGTGTLSGEFHNWVALAKCVARKKLKMDQLRIRCAFR